jgi:hypothetical protein
VLDQEAEFDELLKRPLIQCTPEAIPDSPANACSINELGVGSGSARQGLKGQEGTHVLAAPAQQTSGAALGRQSRASSSFSRRRLRVAVPLK